jgi:toxin ParE1/3/4
MTKPEVILTPQAREDIKHIAAYIKEDSPQSSMAFRQTLENIYEVLLELPEIGTTRNFRNPEMKGLRMLPVQKFNNYLIFYRSTSEGLEIVRVVHGARDVSSLFGG